MKPQSKKQRMAFIGLACIGATYVTALIMLSRQPALASQIVTLAQAVIIAVGTLATGYIGAQGYVDAKSATPAAPPEKSE